jgi:hypothetical protein
MQIVAIRIARIEQRAHVGGEGHARALWARITRKARATC